MKPARCLALALIAAPSLLLALAPKPAAPARLTLPFDARWHFLKGDAPGAEAPGFIDATWRQLDVPHDWSIEGPFDERNPAGGAGAFLPTGVAWYRKHFTLPSGQAGRRVFIQFDGVMQNSDVWINGRLLGHRPFGYASFRYELTDHLKFGEDRENVLAVRTDTSRQPASRWYAGAGIYRHVRLVVTDPVHFTYHSVFVTTPRITADAATVHVTGSVRNQAKSARPVSLQVTLLAPDGREVASVESPAQTIGPDQTNDFALDLSIAQPQLWQLESPALYQAVARVRAAGAALDEQPVTFGIREARFESATGFWLNGRNLKLYGACVHQDGGAFGAAVPIALWEQRLSALRELGVNALRTAHNPPDPGFLDLCDRLGFVVMDELFDCWTVAKPDLAGRPLNDYHLYFDEWSKTDVRDTVRRDRNHPSVILWSAGNEIHDTPQEEKAKRILAGLVQVFHENDPTRPVTQALFRPNVSHDYTNGLADLLDVIGTNYRDLELLEAWRAKPGRKIIGTEQQHDRRTWLTLRDNAPHAGQFLWTGVDYLGESRGWPTVGAGAGLIDRTGAVKPIGRERQSWWSPRPMVAIARRIAPTTAGPTDPGVVPLNRRPVTFADWSPASREPHEESVEVYSNCETVELFLNDQSLGRQPLNADASPRTWKVAFAPGVLRAVATNHGVAAATAELRTAGEPARIVLSANRSAVTASFDDVALVTATIVDANGVVVPGAADLVTFSADGPGAIVAVDSADNASHEPFQATSRRAFRGRCVAFVRATDGTGSITITASSGALEGGSLALNLFR